MPTGVLIGIFVVLVVVCVLAIVMMYNGLVRRRVQCDNAWSQIDVQLKRRYDLIPNLVETVKGYASHERDTLEAVIQARNSAQQVTSDAMHAAEKAQAENMLTQTLGKLFALSEAYPDLKANQNFAKLQEELSSTENRIAYARQHYNDSVGGYEQKRQSIPHNMVAAAFGFAERQYFEMDEATRQQAQEAPKVSFN